MLKLTPWFWKQNISLLGACAEITCARAAASHAREGGAQMRGTSTLLFGGTPRRCEIELFTHVQRVKLYFSHMRNVRNCIFHTFETCETEISNFKCVIKDSGILFHMLWCKCIVFLLYITTHVLYNILQLLQEVWNMSNWINKYFLILLNELFTYFFDKAFNTNLVLSSVWRDSMTLSQGSPSEGGTPGRGGCCVLLNFSHFKCVMLTLRHP